MKKTLLIISIAVVIFSMSSKAQSVTKDANGNYTIAKRDTTGTNKATGQTITTADGKVYPIFKSVNGKLFYLKVAKSGNVYKAYIREV